MTSVQRVCAQQSLFSKDTLAAGLVEVERFSFPHRNGKFKKYKNQKKKKKKKMNDQVANFYYQILFIAEIWEILLPIFFFFLFRNGNLAAIVGDGRTLAPAAGNWRYCAHHQLNEEGALERGRVEYQQI